VKSLSAHGRSATDDWESDVDTEHLELIRAKPATFAPGGILHLVGEVLAE
jgi:topoisomerase IV subunit B